MNPEIKEQWVGALRSGEYKQSNGVLHEVDDNGQDVGFCCLGVLCDLAVKAGVTVDKEIGSSNEVKYDGLGAFLPEKVARWAGLLDSGVADENPGVPNEFLPSKITLRNTGRTALSLLNDDGNDFSKIAEWIEKGL